MSLPNRLDKRVQRRRHALFGPACEREREERKKKSLRPSPPRTAGPGRHNRAGSSVRFLRLSQKATRYYFDVVFHYAPHLTRSTLTGVTHTHVYTHAYTEQRFVLSLPAVLRFFNSISRIICFLPSTLTHLFGESTLVTFAVLSYT